jgi:hypothetical protein
VELTAEHAETEIDPPARISPLTDKPDPTLAELKADIRLPRSNVDATEDFDPTLTLEPIDTLPEITESLPILTVVRKEVLSWTVRFFCALISPWTKQAS